VPIEHPLLDPFEPKLKAILELGFDGGVRSLAAAGYKLGDDLVNKDAREHYRIGLFSAFGKAQSVIGALYIELEITRQKSLAELKALRVERNPIMSDTETLLGVIETRQHILRRLMDGILWVLLPNVWWANHFAIKKDLSRPDLGELKKMLGIASDQNAKNERELHLVSDLTTFVQIGDLLRIRWDDDAVYLRLQEIKTGHVNEVLCDIIESAGGILSEAILDDVQAKLGPHAKTQAMRIVKQRERFGQFTSAIQNNSPPPDTPKRELLTALTKTVPPLVKSYLHLLPELVTDAKARGFGARCIDSCLWLVGITEQWLADFGDVQQLPH
jgi:hypothetical protein